jgi:hypothetical protein
LKCRKEPFDERFWIFARMKNHVFCLFDKGRCTPEPSCVIIVDDGGGCVAIGAEAEALDARVAVTAPGIKIPASAMAHHPQSTSLPPH